MDDNVNKQYKFTEDHRGKIALALKGNKNAEGYIWDETSRTKLSNAHKGRQVRGTGWHHSADTKAKISQSKKGKKSDKCGRSGAENHMFGKPLPPEQLAKMIATRKANYAKLTEEQKAKRWDGIRGEKNPMYGKSLSPEAKAKLSAAHSGKHLSDETKKKMSNAHLGGHLSEEAKAKLRVIKAGTKPSDKCIDKARMTNLGSPCSVEVREKISATNKGQKRSLEARAKMSAAAKGRKASLETLEKMRIASTGRKHSPETCAKIGLASTGRPKSAETIAKLKAALKGEKSPLYGKHVSAETLAKRKKTLTEHPIHRTPEQKAKASEAQKGRHHTPETIAKLSKARKGVPLSPSHKANVIAALNRKGPSSTETKAKISESHKKLWANMQFKEENSKRLRRSQTHKQTKPEKFVEGVLGELYPNEYKYVGSDYSTVINGCFPDFLNVNGQKKVIEVFGDYWHGEKRTGRTKEQEELLKLNGYREVGFDCLIIWQRETKKSPEEVRKRIIAFHKARHKKLEIQPCLL